MEGNDNAIGQEAAALGSIKAVGQGTEPTDKEVTVIFGIEKKEDAGTSPRSRPVTRGIREATLAFVTSFQATSLPTPCLKHSFTRKRLDVLDKNDVTTRFSPAVNATVEEVLSLRRTPRLSDFICTTEGIGRLPM